MRFSPSTYYLRFFALRRPGDYTIVKRVHNWLYHNDVSSKQLSNIVIIERISVHQIIYFNISVLSNIIDDGLYDKTGAVVIDSNNNVVVLPNDNAFTVSYSSAELDTWIDDVDEAMRNIEESGE